MKPANAIGVAFHPVTQRRLWITTDNRVTFFLTDDAGEDQDEWVPHSEHWSAYLTQHGWDVKLVA